MVIQPGLCRTWSETRTLVFSRRGSNGFPADNATITETVALTGVAIQDRGTQSDKVEIGLRLPPANRDIQRLDVRVNGEAIVFDNNAMAWQDFKGSLQSYLYKTRHKIHSLSNEYTNRTTN